jgi:magnesium chelatase subunit I
MSKASTLGQLGEQGYKTRSVKTEMRDNLLLKLREGGPIFPGVIGYDKTVIPQVQNALLSKHDFILLGLRGQAKTRLLRALPTLLDDEIPAIEGCPINDDPCNPVCDGCKKRLEQEGNDLAISWLPRESRYQEKLATPDVTIADLIGDIDPIKAATRKLSFTDPEVIHYGIIPRTNRGIFAINEVPDLQARIQVGLLNILEEGDIQIRGFPIRMPMDIILVFSANPEDYTNRGNIITPLRDRIASQILTHYPRTIEESRAITQQEAWAERGSEVAVPDYLRDIVERVAFEARSSEFVDQNSGVSARMTISLMENVYSNAERRTVLTGSKSTVARVSDVVAASSAITGKIELVYEGEREGVKSVAARLVGQAVKSVFDEIFPDAYKLEEAESVSDYSPVLNHFKKGETLDISDEINDDELLENLSTIPGLEDVTRKYLDVKGPSETAAAMEFVLEALHQSSLLAKDEIVGGRAYRDMFEDMVRNLRN